MKTTVFILEFTELPKQFQKEIADHERFHNDCYLRHLSEFEPEDYMKGMSEVKNYYKDQKENNNYKGSFKKFIVDYSLEFDIWIMEQKFDLTGVEEILIRVCW